MVMKCSSDGGAMTRLKENVSIKRTVPIILGLALVLVVQLIGINHAKSVGTTTDEFGYLYNAATVAGLDWHSVMQYHPYYSPLVSYLWIPLFKLFPENPVIIYQGIVIINIIMVAGIFFSAYYFGKKMLFKDNGIISIMSAIIISLYPAITFNVAIASPEIALNLCFWLVLVFISLYISYDKTLFLIAGFLLLGIMINLHNRTLAIALVSGTFILIYSLIYKRKKIPVIFCLLILVGFYLISNYLKRIYFSNLEIATDLNSLNTVIPTTSLITYFITYFKDTLVSIIGKIYYLLSVGNVAFIGAIIFVFSSCLSLKKDWKNPKPIYIISLYISLVLLGNLIAFSIWTAGSYSRFDYIFYSRYYENILGPFMILGLYEIHKGKIHISLLFGSILLIALTPTVMHSLESVNGSVFAIDSAPGLAASFPYYLDSSKIYLPLLKNICYSLMMFLCYYIILYIIYNKRFRCTNEICNAIYDLRWVILVPMCLYWLFLGVSAEISYNVIRDNEYIRPEKIKRIIDSLGPKDVVYLRNPDDGFISLAKRLQVMMPLTTIKVESLKADFKPQENVTYVVDSSQKTYNKLSKNEGIAIHDYEGVDIYVFEENDE